MYDQLTKTILDDQELASDHLNWLANNIFADTPVNIIAWRKEIKGSHYGKTIGLLRGIAIGLERHFTKALDKVQEKEMIYTSIKVLIIHELLDTMLHEKYHLMRMEAMKNWENARSKKEEIEAKKFAAEEVYNVARDYDIDITSFGPYIDHLLGEFLNDLHEDVEADNCPEWKKLQLYMLENNLGYFKKDEEIEYSIRLTFEAMSGHEDRWDPEPTQCQPEELETEQESTEIPIDEQVAETETTEDYQEDDWFDYEDETTTTAQTSIQTTMPTTTVQQPIQQPITTPPTAAGIKTITELILKRLFNHIMDKCQSLPNGSFANPQAILEPVPINDIEGATALFSNMDTVDAVGTFVKATSTTGGIKGLLSKDGKLPYYRLYVNIGGQFYQRSFIPQNPLKTDTAGNLTKWATLVQNGHKIVMLMNEKGVTVDVKLEPGKTLGQEEIHFWND